MFLYRNNIIAEGWEGFFEKLLIGHIISVEKGWLGMTKEVQ
jgi:hypothetical protein